MPTGYLVTLGDGNLDSGDTISGGAVSFTADGAYPSGIGAGQWIWSGTAGGDSYSNEVEPGVYWLADNGNVYFVPDYGLVDSISSASVQSAPEYPPSSDGVVSGTAGDDVIDGSYTDNDGDEVDAGDGSGASGNEDTISAGAGNDTIESGDESDTVYGGSGDDSIAGNSGDDVIYGDDDPNEQSDVSITTANHTDTGNGYTVTAQNVVGGALTSASASNLGTYAGSFGANGTVSDTDSGVNNQLAYDKASGLSETVIVDFDAPIDELTFTTLALHTSSHGEVGHYAIYNGGVLVYETDFTDSTGSGSDTFTVSGHGNFDKIVFTAKIQSDGSDGSDYGITDITFTPASTAEDGDDTISGGLGADTIYGGDGNDSLSGDGGTDTLYGEEGHDTLDGGSGNDSLDGGDGNDSLSGGNGHDTLSGGSGNDTLEGDDGNDTLSGGADQDSLDGGTGDDSLDGGSGDDTISGGSGADTVSGGSGSDTIDGGTGGDSVDAGSGSDTIYVDQGDTVSGGDGDDTFILQNLDTSGTGNDSISITGGEGDETSGDTLILGPDVSYSDITFTDTDPSGPGLSGHFTTADGTFVSFSQMENIICFTSGTHILTQFGERAIDTLQVGDMVVTRDHGLQPIRWIGRRSVPGTGKFAPISIESGNADRVLLVSPQHRVLYTGSKSDILFGEREVLVAAKHLVDNQNVRITPCPEVTYIHLMFDRHEVIYAQGMASESFHAGDVGLSAISDPARDELFSIFPELRSHTNAHGDAARTCLRKHEARLLLDMSPHSNQSLSLHI